MKRTARMNYYREKATLYSHDISKMWRLVNEISNRKRKSSNSIKCLSDKNGKKLEDPLCIANCLNTHFSSVGKNMAADIDNEISPKRLKDPLDYLPKKV